MLLVSFLFINQKAGNNFELMMALDEKWWVHQSYQNSSWAHFQEKSSNSCQDISVKIKYGSLKVAQQEKSGDP